MQDFFGKRFCLKKSPRQFLEEKNWIENTPLRLQHLPLAGEEKY
jgi:hypothetical protein